MVEKIFATKREAQAYANKLNRANRWLRRMFRNYNATYFDDRLEEPKVVTFGPMEGKEKNASGWSHKPPQAEAEIRIDENLIEYRRAVEIILIHEMAHLATWGYHSPHGMLFQAELHRLYMMGAYEGLL